MTPKELAEKICHIFNVPASYDARNGLPNELYVSLESLISEALEAAVADARAEAQSEERWANHYFKLEEAKAAAYVAGLKRGIGDPKWHELVSIVRKQAYESAAKIAESYWDHIPQEEFDDGFEIPKKDHPDFVHTDIAKQIRAKASEVKG